MPTRYTSKRPSLGRKSTQQHSIIHSCPQAQHSQYHVLFLFLFFLVTSYFVLLVNFSCWSFLTWWNIFNILMLLTEFCVNIVEGLYFCYLFSLLMIYKSTSTALPLFSSEIWSWFLVPIIVIVMILEKGERRKEKERDNCGWREWDPMQYQKGIAWVQYHLFPHNFFFFFFLLFVVFYYFTLLNCSS